jgi:hypothetical protein
MLKLLTKPIKSFWERMNKKTEIIPSLPTPRNPGVRIDAFDWQCEQSRFSTVGSGEDVTVYWTVVYRGNYCKK